MDNIIDLAAFKAGKSPAPAPQEPQKRKPCGAAVAIMFEGGDAALLPLSPQELVAILAMLEG